MQAEDQVVAGQVELGGESRHLRDRNDLVREHPGEPLPGVGRREHTRSAPPPISTELVTTATAPPVESWPKSLLARDAACSPSASIAGPSAGSARTARQMSPPLPARGPVNPVPGGVVGRGAGAAGGGPVRAETCGPAARHGWEVQVHLTHVLLDDDR